MNNNLMNLKLETLKEFQDKYPKAHVGGSIGLFLRGIDLLRDLKDSDLDITVDEFDCDTSSTEYLRRSDGNDFDHAIKKYTGVYYVKIDIRICPEPSFDEIAFDGVKYNVSKYEDIIFWKTKYAEKGIRKHIKDLEVIATRIRTTEPYDVAYDVDLGGLPF